ncbi:MAG: DUF1579 family protein [Candidatus Latescibacteria bacterium]|nr:DUF1579 family protein [Candidatus Latescibacterota bacterium]MCB9516855.1 DUF1579 family protein [Candidatus Latescibacterota bacterium]
MQMPTPAPGHRLLERLAGVWEGEETMFPSQWDPAGGTAQGRTESRLALGGFALIGDYTQEREGRVTFRGHSVMTYDPKADLYTLHWFDSLGSPPEVFTGRFDGDVLVHSHGGPHMHVRLTYDRSEEGTLGSSMEMSPDGKDWKRLFEARYRFRR